MPELPEVEAARRAVAEHCVGKKIKRAIIADDSKVIDGVSPKDFEASLLGKTIVAAHRKGKNMWIELDSPPFPSFQFGMAGAVYIKGVAVTKYKRSAVKDDDEWPSKYSKVFIELDDGVELSFTDKRRFAKVRLLKNPVSAPPISELGPDALLEPRTINEFVESLSKKKTPIKALLLDQSYIAGIGNWIADEVLYQARIHPSQTACSLSKESCESLLKSINEVIEKSVEVGADSSQFPENWIFHSREKKPGKAFVDGLAPDCYTIVTHRLAFKRKKIEFITAGGRTTAYVPELQKLPKDQEKKLPNKPKKKSSDGDDEENEENKEENPKKTKSKSGEKNTKGQVKSGPVKRKAKESHSDDDDDEDEEDEEVEVKKTAKVTKKRVKTSQASKSRKKSK